MNPTNAATSEEALAIRHEFDLAFTQQPPVQQAAPLNFLGIRIEGDAFAIRASEIAGLYSDRPIMPLPTPVKTLLGLVGFRGLIAPVYHLGAMLGYMGKVGNKSSPRWMVLVRLKDPIALAFDHMESHFKATAENIVQVPKLDSRTHHESLCDEAVRINNGEGSITRPIISLQSLLDTIQQSTNPSFQHGSKTS